ncbi:NADH:ubiquinone oxidoreductaseintermediate-associated protein 30, partial [Striga asiatica]
VIMPRTYLPISQITDETRHWTAFIQVVERAPIQTSKSNPQVLYRRYLFTDGEVRLETPLYQVGPYEFNWLLHKKTLVEEFEEEVPPPLPCQIEIHAFEDLHRYADTENPRIAIEDATGNIHAMLYDSDAERVIPFNGTDLFEAEQQGVDLTGQITVAMNEHRVVCFIKHYESTHHTVLKLYTVDAMQADKNFLEPKHLVEQASASASIKVPDKVLFSPTLKNVLTSLTPAREKPAPLASSEPAVKKRINFDNQQSSTIGSNTPFTQIPETSTQTAQQTTPACDTTPTKKSRPKMD